MACRKKLASGQWWYYCGETDMGQTAPALCVECEPITGHLLDGATLVEVEANQTKRAAAMYRFQAAGFAGCLEDYWETKESA